MIETRDIAGCPGYRVDIAGDVWSCRIVGHRNGMSSTWRKLRPRKITGGRYQVALHDGTGRVDRLVHHLVLEAFVGPCPPGMEACHWDGDPSNNALSNLRWDTHQSNMDDKSRHGTVARGEMIPRAKLTEDIVRSIRDDIRSGVDRKTVREKYSLSAVHLGKIVNRKLWNHVA